MKHKCNYVFPGRRQQTGDLATARDVYVHMSGPGGGWVRPLAGQGSGLSQPSPFAKGPSTQPSRLPRLHGLAPVLSSTTARGVLCEDLARTVAEEPRWQPRSGGPSISQVPQTWGLPNDTVRGHGGTSAEKATPAPGGMFWKEVLPSQGSTAPHHGRVSPHTAHGRHRLLNPSCDTEKNMLVKKFTGSPQP